MASGVLDRFCPCRRGSSSAKSFPATSKSRGGEAAIAASPSASTTIASFSALATSLLAPVAGEARSLSVPVGLIRGPLDGEELPCTGDRSPSRAQASKEASAVGYNSQCGSTETSACSLSQSSWSFTLGSASWHMTSSELPSAATRPLAGSWPESPHEPSRRPTCRLRSTAASGAPCDSPPAWTGASTCSLSQSSWSFTLGSASWHMTSSELPSAATRPLAGSWPESPHEPSRRPTCRLRSTAASGAPCDSPPA
mmetsp:Transcript_5505/g.15924  ORF Transcript_5505/g.15924 Transcript_5505/m.15924 type:complete len:254 (+) Transcript_5505:368-1129(+)